MNLNEQNDASTNIGGSEPDNSETEQQKRVTNATWNEASRTYTVYCTCTDDSGVEHTVSAQCPTTYATCYCSDPKHPRIVCD